MSHQPFETWMFSDEHLEEEQQKALEAHLATCEACAARRDAWRQVESIFSQAPTASPIPGFRNRWENRLAVYKQQRQQRLAWLLVFGLFAAASLIFLGLAGFSLLNTPLDYALGQIIANFGRLAARFGQFVHFVRAITESFPILIPIGLIFGVGILSAMLTLIVTWFMSVIRLYKPINEGVTVR